MENPNKYLIDDKVKMVQDSNAVYEIDISKKLDPVNTDEQEVLLKKLLALGLKQSEIGLGQSHEDVMAEIKKKYNLPLNV